MRIIGDYYDPTADKFRRAPLGTGFCVSVESESEPGRWHNYIVTAQHVVEGQASIDLAIPDARNPGELSPLVRTEGPDWVQPIDDVDLAAFPFERPDGYWVTALREGQHLLESLPADAMLAMPFHYVGLLEPLDRAMARSGTLGAVHQTGLPHPSGYNYTAHLGDCRTYSGFSGSPCFIELGYPGLDERDPLLSLGEDAPRVGRNVYVHLVCGMVTWHLESGPDHGASSALGVVVMLTSDEIWRCLMTEQMRTARSDAEDSG